MITNDVKACFENHPEKWEAGVIQDSLPDGFHPTVTGSSATRAKLDLFFSLFRGSLATLCS